MVPDWAKMPDRDAEAEALVAEVRAVTITAADCNRILHSDSVFGRVL